MSDEMTARLASARARKTPWDVERDARGLESALERRGSIRRRNTFIRRGVAVASGALLVAFAFRAVAFSPHAEESAAQQIAPSSPAQAEAPSPREELASQELASRLSDGGYGRD